MQTLDVPTAGRPALQLRGFSITAGIVFVVAGLAALAAPRLSTIMVEDFVALLLVLWGGLGMVFSSSFRALPGWIAMAASFGMVLLAGVIFLAFPVAGIEVMTALLVLVFLLEGALQILVGLRTGQRDRGSRWLIASGAVSFVLGCAFIIEWPVSSAWAIGLIVGANFLSSGIALLLEARRIPHGSIW